MVENLKIPTEVLEAFGFNDNTLISQNSDGLINTTFFIEDDTSKIVLQKINRQVFKDARAIQSNYEKVYNYVRQQESNFLMPKPVLTVMGNNFFIDSVDDYWRGFYFVANSVSKPVITNVAEAYTVASLFGRLLRVLDKFPAADLQDAIPQFHNLRLRYQQFDDALEVCDSRRKEEAALLIDDLQKRKKYVALYDKIVQQKEKYPLRVLHHDAKIANILFDKTTGEVLCAVDFDTLMPGYFFSDFGDLIRASACSRGEEETDLSKVFINPDYFEALLKGYLTEAKEILTHDENALLIFSGHLIIYMQCLRFTTDFLLGDIYYKTSYKGQNLNRAFNQLALLESLENFVPASFHQV